MQEVFFEDLGRIPYKEAWSYQDKLVQTINSIKLQNRQKESADPTPNYLLFCEHPHVYTLGKSGAQENLIWNAGQLKEKGVEFVHTNRGGDITYHGPGQIVGYPILDLENYFTDLHRYLRTLEKIIILTLNDLGIEAGLSDGLTGVWLDSDNPAKARKICAMGVKCTRWITLHGFALNINPDLSYFSGIVPCGIKDKAVTSVKQELGYVPDYDKIKASLLKNFAEVFDSRIVNMEHDTFPESH